MIRSIVVALAVSSGHAAAEAPGTVIGPPRTAAPREASPAAEPCENTRDGDNCSRVLACMGEDGLWFDGRADGWNAGTLRGRMSDGTTCAGEWGYAWHGMTAWVAFQCDDGRTGRGRYTAQDPETGTGLGRGELSDGTAFRAWTGRNVLDFLTPEGERRALLPCEGGAVPIS